MAVNGPALRTARKEAGFSAAEVRRRTRIPESAVYDFERNKRRPTLAQIAGFALIYGVPPESLIAEPADWPAIKTGS